MNVNLVGMVEDFLDQLRRNEINAFTVAEDHVAAVRPLIGSESVVELGCGPGLALRLLRDEGTRTVLGVDRWPGFVTAAAAHGIPVLLHDLTLPMPFIPTASVDL